MDLQFDLSESREENDNRQPVEIWNDQSEEILVNSNVKVKRKHRNKYIQSQANFNNLMRQSGVIQANLESQINKKE